MIGLIMQFPIGQTSVSMNGQSQYVFLFSRVQNTSLIPIAIMMDPKMYAMQKPLQQIILILCGLNGFVRMKYKSRSSKKFRMMYMCSIINCVNLPQNVMMSVLWKIQLQVNSVVNPVSTMKGFRMYFKKNAPPSQYWSKNYLNCKLIAEYAKISHAYRRYGCLSNFL